MGFKDVNTFFIEDYPRCWFGVESVGNRLPLNGASFERITDRNGHIWRLLGEGILSNEAPFSGRRFPTLSTPNQHLG